MPPATRPAAARARAVAARLLLLGAFAVLARFAFVVAIYGERCVSADFCFLSSPEAHSVAAPGGAAAGSKALAAGSPAAWTSRGFRKAVGFYSSLFQSLAAEGFLPPVAKALSLGSPQGHEAFALREIGLPDAVAVARKKSPPLVIAADPLRLPFRNNTFDFVFCGIGTMENSPSPALLAAEIERMLQPEGFLVVHISSPGDLHSLGSLVNLFPSCELAKSHEIDGPEMSQLHELVLRKRGGSGTLHPGDNSVKKCSIPEHKLQVLGSAEALIEEEPLKPWITLKRNLKNIKYLPSIADIRFKRKYVYIDVGARSYGSSIVSWFKKQYPKPNKTFEIYAIEADKAFHGEYSAKKGVTLLPYAAWVRNETLSFEVGNEPGGLKSEGRGMGRITPVSGSSSSGSVHSIQGFDLAEWIKTIVNKQDFVVMKMDVEGTEFDLIPRLFETGAICLIDELFLECHYNRWQKCCPGQRSPKYQKTYGQCLELFSSLRESGVLVHQWW